MAQCERSRSYHSGTWRAAPLGPVDVILATSYAVAAFRHLLLWTCKMPLCFECCKQSAVSVHLQPFDLWHFTPSQAQRKFAVHQIIILPYPFVGTFQHDPASYPGCIGWKTLCTWYMLQLGHLDRDFSGNSDVLFLLAFCC